MATERVSLQRSRVKAYEATAPFFVKTTALAECLWPRCPTPSHCCRVSRARAFQLANS
jgi:hypothetical protein